VIVATIVLSALGLTTTADAAFPGTPGSLVLSSAGNIYTIAADGSPPLSQLTFDGQSDHPRWSPDGHRIAFDRSGDIFVMDANGRNARQVTTVGDASEPAWSPSGKRLVFVRRPNVETGGDLWTVAASGGAPSRLTFQGRRSCEISSPVWSPRGGRIAYEWEQATVDTGCSAKRVVIMRIEPRARVVIEFASHPDFTADGRGVFFGSRFDPVDGSFWPGENLSWSGLRGGGRQRLTSLFCAEGDPCFRSGAAAPDSGFPGAARAVYVFSRLGGTICVGTLGSADGFCSTTIPVRPLAVDWQPVTSG
jgi:dipeptidyl aminopeptidase/acylaminoacyl peptidase